MVIDNMFSVFGDDFFYSLVKLAAELGSASNTVVFAMTYLEKFLRVIKLT